MDTNNKNGYNILDMCKDNAGNEQFFGDYLRTTKCYIICYSASNNYYPTLC